MDKLIPIAIHHYWAVQWRSENYLDGYREHLIYENYFVKAFKTRKLAREFNNEHYAYLRDRDDLRKEPFGWKLTRVVKIKVAYTIE